MFRGVVTLGLLAGAGWYAYRRLVGRGSEPVATAGPPFSHDAPGTAGSVRERVTQSVSQAAAAARQAATGVASKARAAVPGKRDEAIDQPDAADDGEAEAVPREARAAAMAAMPAVQPPATIPEP